MKKLFSLLLVGCMLFSFAGCGDAAGDDTAVPPADTVQPADPESSLPGSDALTDSETEAGTESNLPAADNTDKAEANDSNPTSSAKPADKPAASNKPGKNESSATPPASSNPSAPSTPQTPVLPESPEVPATPPTAATPLSDIMSAILSGAGYEFQVDNQAVSSDRFSWFFGIDAIDGAEGYSSEALIGSIAHSVALLRVPEGTDAAALADTIQSSVDPRKWICVEAEKTIVKSHGSVILVVLSSADVADTIAANFDAYF